MLAVAPPRASCPTLTRSEGKPQLAVARTPPQTIVPYELDGSLDTRSLDHAHVLNQALQSVLVDMMRPSPILRQTMNADRFKERKSRQPPLLPSSSRACDSKRPEKKTKSRCTQQGGHEHEHGSSHATELRRNICAAIARPVPPGDHRQRSAKLEYVTEKIEVLEPHHVFEPHSLPLRTWLAQNREHDPYMSDGFVKGVWTCCKSGDPLSPGCMVTHHSNEDLQCAQCGGWVPVKIFSEEACIFHHQKPQAHRMFGGQWMCCGRRGWQQTKYADRPPEEWASRRRARMSTGSWEFLGLGATSTSCGCTQGVHHRLRPAPLCPHCGLKQRDDQEECSACGVRQRVCTQCMEVVGTAEDQDLDEAVPPCQFHPGLFCASRSLKLELKSDGAGFVGVRDQPLRLLKYRGPPVQSPRSERCRTPPTAQPTPRTPYQIDRGNSQSPTARKPAMPVTPTAPTAWAAPATPTTPTTPTAPTAPPTLTTPATSPHSPSSTLQVIWRSNSAIPRAPPKLQPWTAWRPAPSRAAFSAWTAPALYSQHGYRTAPPRLAGHYSSPSPPTPVYVKGRSPNLPSPSFPGSDDATAFLHNISMGKGFLREKAFPL